MPAPRVRSLIFVLIFGFACASYLQRQGIGIAAERMMPELGLTQVHIGWLMNAFLVTYAAFQVPGGLFGQRFGARLTIAVIGTLSVLASVVTAAAPLIATSALMFTTLVIARSLLGIAHGGLFPVEAGTIRHWYPVGRWSSMLGLLVTGLWTGAAVASPLVASLMQAYGWQAAILLTSVPSLLLVVLWWIVVRDLPGQHPWVKTAELAETAANPPYTAAPLTLRRVGRVLGDPQILLVTLSYLVMNYVFYLVTFWSFRTSCRTGSSRCWRAAGWGRCHLSWRASRQPPVGELQTRCAADTATAAAPASCRSSRCRWPHSSCT